MKTMRRLFQFWFFIWKNVLFLKRLWANRFCFRHYWKWTKMSHYGERSELCLLKRLYFTTTKIEKKRILYAQNLAKRNVLFNFETVCLRPIFFGWLTYFTNWGATKLWRISWFAEMPSASLLLRHLSVNGSSIRRQEITHVISSMVGLHPETGSLKSG